MTLSNKVKTSAFEKDPLFYNFYKNVEDENILYKDRKHQIPFYTLFIERRKDIDCSTALYSIKVPFELLHPDVANSHFFQSQQLIQLMFYILLTYSLLKFILIQ